MRRQVLASPVVALSMAWHRTLAVHASIVARRNLAFLPLAQAILFPRCPQALPPQLPQKPPGRALAPKIAFPRLLAHGQHGYAKIDGDSPLGMLDFLDVVGTHQDQGKPPLPLSADRHALEPAAEADLLTDPHPVNAGKPDPRAVDTKGGGPYGPHKNDRAPFSFSADNTGRVPQKNARKAPPRSRIASSARVPDHADHLRAALSL